MITLLLVFLLLAFVILATSVGVIFGRKPITGSCGGIGAALGEKNYTCDICGDDPSKCDEQQSKVVQNPNLAVNAIKPTDKNPK
ncbi:MAG: hypothetical protein ACI80S_001696 [Pseudohongiellaceae bacterium]|jgi:hypothetical protein